jgi:hypothetical protein
MLAIFFGGIALYPDAPLHECSGISGYCGKQGQPHTAADYHRFMVWQTALFVTWPIGFIAIAILKWIKS